MLSDLKLILAGIAAFVIAASIGLVGAFKSGKSSQKNKQIAKDLHAADDAKKRLEDSRNQPIDDKLDSLHKHG